MSFLTHLFRPHIELPAGLAGRLRAWQALPKLNERSALAAARFVVVDVETSACDPARDTMSRCTIQCRVRAPIFWCTASHQMPRLPASPPMPR
jgi:hypothetical protein